MAVKVGDKLPDVKMKKATSAGPADTSTSEEFAGKKIALFAVPGAFTPTCSAKHLPSFVGNADKLAAVIVEPILGAGGNIPGNREFMKMLRRLTSDAAK